MFELMQTPRIDATLAGPCAHGPTGLSVRQIVGHVARMSDRLPHELAVEQLIDIAAACAQLGARRQVLSTGLATQETLDRLAQIALGRELVNHRARVDREAVESIQKNMQTRLARILGEWRQSGQRFTQLTRLLPVQLTSDWPALPVLDSARRHELMRRVPAELRAEFERTCDHYLSAHRRCIRATHETERSREEHQAAETSFRGGQCSAFSLAQALMHLQRQTESQLHAEADRMGAHHMLELLAQPVRALSVT